eukprot:COSAG02_NODE_5628_length_4174_cov_3.981591_1_plen_95_part_00
MAGNGGQPAQGPQGGQGGGGGGAPPNAGGAGRGRGGGAHMGGQPGGPQIMQGGGQPMHNPYQVCCSLPRLLSSLQRLWLSPLRSFGEAFACPAH